MRKEKEEKRKGGEEERRKVKNGERRKGGKEEMKKEERRGGGKEERRKEGSKNEGLCSIFLFTVSALQNSGKKKKLKKYLWSDVAVNDELYVFIEFLHSIILAYCDRLDRKSVV